MPKAYETLDDGRTVGYTAPDIEELVMWAEEGGSETPCGCWVEPDGICEHGHKSWLLIMGMI